MEQNQETLPPPQHLETNSALESTGEPGESKQNSRFSPPKQTLEMESSLRLTTTLRTSRTRADWVNTLWADVSGQLRRLSVISNDLFDGLLLKRYTPTGSLILKELRKQYKQLGDDRNLATVRVCVPEKPTSELWQLYWTILRHRDPNGRQFHSEMTIVDPQSHLKLDSDPGQTLSVFEFSLPLFIQDYGPGPSDFDPEPENEFYPMTWGTMTDFNAGTSVGEEPEADGTD